MVAETTGSYVAGRRHANLASETSLQRTDADARIKADVRDKKRFVEISFDVIASTIKRALIPYKLIFHSRAVVHEGMTSTPRRLRTTVTIYRSAGFFDGWPYNATTLFLMA